MELASRGSMDNATRFQFRRHNVEEQWLTAQARAQVQWRGLDAGLCKGFVESLTISGAAISVFSGLSPATMVCASDAVAARIDELQFDLGEGPRWEALQTRRPVLLPDVRRGPHAAWPVFAESILELEVSALFVFPLVLGALDIGVAELYRSESGPLSQTEQSTHGPAPASSWRTSTSWLSSLVEAITWSSPDGSTSTSPAAAASRIPTDSSTRVWRRSKTS